MSSNAAVAVCENLFCKDYKFVFRSTLDLMGALDIKWVKSGTERAENYMLFCAEGKEDHLETGFFHA